MKQELLAGDSNPEDVVADSLSSKVYKSVLGYWGELFKCCCCPFMVFRAGPVMVIEQGQVGVQTRFGKFDRVLPPGMYVYNILTQNIQKVQMRMQTIEVPQQAAMTQDNLTVKVDAVTFVTVVDPKRALFQVDNYHRAVKTLAASTMLRILAEHDLQQVFTNRAQINSRLTQMMQDKTAGWGLQVSSVELRDITIPDSMQRAMAQIAEANREAEAKVITAEGQRKAASIMAAAAETMEKQPMSFQLQWFETLRAISAEKNSTVIVPDSVIGTLSHLTRNCGASVPEDFTKVGAGR
jgi:regulator of protease activity HflC (stomatin/prohibitin superfamily)